ncbi:MAG: preprotein translocase subunit SecG, partial [Candidatus Electrothrix sp. AW5]|nr:preprotein translocase subunit SecG [Candidatus Electrothrix gigas]
MTTLLIIVHILVSLFLIAIVLLQHGKGADIGATFGGSGQSVFGSEGPVPLLNKITTFSAIVFMGTSVSLAYLSAHESTGSIMKELPARETAAPTQPKAPMTIPMPGTEAAAPVKQEAEAKPVPQAKKAEPAPAPAQEVKQAEQATPVKQEAEEKPVPQAKKAEPAPVPAQEVKQAEQAAPVKQEAEAKPVPQAKKAEPAPAPAQDTGTGQG